jgi:NTP pyrophosphohydrolases including oxidative damage repair enzymes
LYRSGVGMMVVNREDRIFVGQRYHKKLSNWQMPQGGIEVNEVVDQAMLRELQEETSICNVEILAKSKKWHFYDLPSELATRLWGGQFKGQKQIWYALRFQGEDSEINIHTLNPEFRDWKWVEKEEVLDLIIPFKKDLYTQVFDELWPYVEQQNLKI